MTVYQLVPSKTIAGGSGYEPDEHYYVKIKDGMEISSTTNGSVIFRTIDAVDFANSDSREIDVHSRDTLTGAPTFYLVTKKVKAISAKEKETNLIVPNVDYPSITLSDTDVIQIVSVTEGSNKYYEVPYLAQESIFVENSNMESNSDLNSYSNEVPYILEVQKVPRRFSVKVNSDNTMDLQFGNGDVSMPDETILPNTKETL
jgi:hypothetical protein